MYPKALDGSGVVVAVGVTVGVAVGDGRGVEVAAIVLDDVVTPAHAPKRG